MINIHIAKTDKQLVNINGYTDTQLESFYEKTTNTCIMGIVGSGKTSLLKHIVSQYRYYLHYDTPIFYPINNDIWIDNDFTLPKLSPTTVQELVIELNDIKQDMMKRLGILEKLKVNNYTKTDKMGCKFIFIDDLDMYLYNAKQESEELYNDLHNTIVSILRLGNAVGIQVFYSCQSFLGEITDDIIHNTYRKIFIGKIYDSEYEKFDIYNNISDTTKAQISKESITIYMRNTINVFTRLPKTLL